MKKLILSSLVIVFLSFFVMAESGSGTVGFSDSFGTGLSPTITSDSLRWGYIDGHWLRTRSEFSRISFNYGNNYFRHLDFSAQGIDYRKRFVSILALV